MMKFLLAILMLAGGWSTFAQATSEAILGFNNNGVSGTFTGTAGWTFQVTNTVTVTELGCLADFFPNNTTTSPVQVGLWGSGASPLASVFVTPSSSVQGQSLYEPITEVSISPGTTYHVGIYFGGLLYSLNVAAPSLGGSVSTASEVASLSAARGSGGFASPPTEAGTLGAAYLGPNFQFRTGGDVPEPSTGALLLLGGLLLAGRGRGGRR
jgi:hypothetical protein